MRDPTMCPLTRSAECSADCELYAKSSDKCVLWVISASLLSIADSLERKTGVRKGGKVGGMPLEYLGLMQKTYNWLRRANITTVGELLQKSDADLLELRGFGQKSLEEVKERLSTVIHK